MRSKAQNLFEAGVEAADPERAVARALQAHPLPDVLGRVLIVAVGKAANGMALAAHAIVGDVSRTIIVTNYENATEVEGAEVFAAGHPVPDENGLAGAEAILDLLRNAGPEDHVLALFSGGGSALLPAPVEGVTLEDKAEVSRVLLASGIDIYGMNLVRQQLSRLKGGGFLRAAAPARVTALILSDVVGDDLRVIASGPTVAPIGSKADVRTMLTNAGIWDAMPKSVRAHLSVEVDDPGPRAEVENHLIGSNSISVAAMAACAPEATVWPEPLIGDVADAAGIVANIEGSGVWLFGGETTVRLTGDGLGGRNQELALRVALAAEDLGWEDGWVFLSGGTDGRDGPTDAAGGIVDAGTLDRMRAAGVDPLQALANNDSYHALQAAGDLLMTGATGTNVADLQVLIRP